MKLSFFATKAARSLRLGHGFILFVSEKVLALGLDTARFLWTTETSTSMGVGIRRFAKANAVSGSCVCHVSYYPHTKMTKNCSCLPTILHISPSLHPYLPPHPLPFATRAARMRTRISSAKCLGMCSRWTPCHGRGQKSWACLKMAMLSQKRMNC
jgi:hypothetical protein